MRIGYIVSRMRCNDKIKELKKNIANEPDEQKKIDLQNEIDSFTLRIIDLNKKIKPDKDKDK